MVFDRPRPDLVPHDPIVYTASFPSGHSMLSGITHLTFAAVLGPGAAQSSTKEILSRTCSFYNPRSGRQQGVSRSALAIRCAGGLGCRSLVGASVLAYCPLAAGTGRDRIGIGGDLYEQSANSSVSSAGSWT